MYISHKFRIACLKTKNEWTYAFYSLICKSYDLFRPTVTQIIKLRAIGLENLSVLTGFRTGSAAELPPLAYKTVEKMVKWPKNEMLLNIQNQTIDRKSLDNSLFIWLIEYLTFKLEDFHEWTEIHRDLHSHNPRTNSKNIFKQDGINKLYTVVHSVLQNVHIISRIAYRLYDIDRPLFFSGLSYPIRNQK